MMPTELKSAEEWMKQACEMFALHEVIDVEFIRAIQQDALASRPAGQASEELHRPKIIICSVCGNEHSGKIGYKHTCYEAIRALKSKPEREKS